MHRLIFILLLLSTTISYSQTESKTDSTSNDTIPPDPDWKLSAITNVLANQANFKNWQGGGVNSMSFSAYLDVSADYSKNKWSWDNDLKLGYGSQFQEVTEWRKTDDIVHYITKVGYALDTAKKWRATGAASFRSQLSDGFEYPTDSTFNKTSSWLAPGYVTVGLGIEYKPESYVSFLLTPLTSKITIVNDQNLADKGTYGNEAAVYDDSGNLVSSGKNVRTEFGASFGIQFKKEVLKNITYKSTLGLFSNYQENPENVDVIFNNMLVFKVNKLINFTFVWDMIYDDDIKITELNSDGSVNGVGPRLQVKQLFGFGLSYTVRNFTPPKPKK